MTNIVDKELVSLLKQKNITINYMTDFYDNGPIFRSLLVELILITLMIEMFVNQSIHK